MKEANYRPELDGIRAICVLITITNHIPGAPYMLDGTMGVDIFFALSGWLIPTLLIREFLATGKIALKAFYIRRFFRIVPLYLFTIGLYAIASVAMVRLNGSYAEYIEFLKALPWLVSFNSEYRDAADGNLFGHAWTLGIEEKFYILLPLMMFIFIAGFRKSSLFFLMIFGALALASNFHSYLVRGYLGLGFGALLASCVQLKPVSSILAKRVCLYSSAALVVVFYALGRIYPHPLFWNVLVSWTAALMIASLWIAEGSMLARALAVAPLVVQGRLTYAIYLIHVLVINLTMLSLKKIHLDDCFAITFACAWLGSIAIAVALNKIIEAPLIKLGKKLCKAKAF